jgi:hypothetical protein
LHLERLLESRHRPHAHILTIAVVATSNNYPIRHVESGSRGAEPKTTTTLLLLLLMMLLLLLVVADLDDLPC